MQLGVPTLSYQQGAEDRLRARTVLALVQDMALVGERAAMGGIGGEHAIEGLQCIGWTILHVKGNAEEIVHFRIVWRHLERVGGPAQRVVDPAEPQQVRNQNPVDLDRQIRLFLERRDEKVGGIALPPLDQGAVGSGNLRGKLRGHGPGGAVSAASPPGCIATVLAMRS